MIQNVSEPHYVSLTTVYSLSSGISLVEMSHDELERFEKLCTGVEWAAPYANAPDELKDRRASPL